MIHQQPSHAQFSEKHVQCSNFKNQQYANNVQNDPIHAQLHQPSNQRFLDTPQHMQQASRRNTQQLKQLQTHQQLLQKQGDQILFVNQKPKSSKQDYKDLLAERPQNTVNSPSSQFIVTKPINIPASSKTSMNFHKPSSKKQINKSKSIQKIILAKHQNSQINNLNEPPMQQIGDLTVLTLLYKVIERIRQSGNDMTFECLMNQQKLINISMVLLEKKIILPEDIEQLYSLENQIIAFVQKINRVTMQNFKEQNQSVDIKLFSKAVDILMTPHLNRFVKNLKTLGKIKVLTFNNLACIYKKKKKFGIALRSVSFALQIEEALLNQQANEQKYDIIPTYLNKAAILSEMGKHEKAIQEIMKSQKFIQKIEREVIKQINQAQNSENHELSKRLEQKRYYGLYMKMLINYNMGAQKQHLKMFDSCCEYYKQGRQLAIMINNQFMIKKFEKILNKVTERTRGLK